MRTWLCIAVVAIIIYSLGTMPPSSDTLLPAASAAPLPATVAFPREFTPLVRTAVEQKTHWKDPAKPLEVSLPAVFTEKTRVRCAGFEVAVSPQHARASEAEPLSDTALIYRDAFPGCDVRYECSQFKTEEFIDVKETTESIRRFSWSLAGGELQPRLTAAHTIEFCDADGTPRIRINAPEGKDANGRLLLPGKELCYELAGDELTLVADLTACRFPVVIDPTFASTGTMATARKAHRAERLQNGKVLVCGGYADNSFALNSAELYDPATGTFSATGSMNVARGNHISVMLNDGRVMVLAGSNTDFILTPHPQCEIYDPASGAWTLTDPQPNVYTATVLQDGRVLSSNLQLFDPLAGTWSPTGMFNVSHGELQFVTLTDGRVLAISVSAQEPCEVFNPITETWSVVGSLNAPHSRAPSVLLADGTVLILPQLGQPALTESFNPASGTWTVKTPALSTHSHLTRLLDGRVLATGNVNNTTGSLSEVYSPGTDRWIETSNLGRRGAHTSTLLSDGKVLITGGNIFDIFFVPGGTEGRLSASASARIYDPAAPDLTASASPVVVVVGESVSFTSLGTDLGGESLTYLWNFGDGTTSSQSTVTHAYQAGGLYPVVLTVTNTSGKYAEARYDIYVLDPALKPTARFVTTDVVGFVGVPLGFDAIFSSDPQNAILAYTWNFGDGSPIGFGPQISRVYTAAGVYTVTLTIRDRDNLLSTATRQIVILPADQIGQFNSDVSYKVKWDRTKPNVDSFSLDAIVNVGADLQVTGGTAVELGVAGETLSATLDLKLRAKTVNSSWQVIAGTRKQAAGEVRMKVKIRRANLGAGFNEAGVVAGQAGDDTELDIPIRFKIGSRAFDIAVPSEFKFSSDGKKVSGGGEGP